MALTALTGPSGCDELCFVKEQLDLVGCGSESQQPTELYRVVRDPERVLSVYESFEFSP